MMKFVRFWATGQDIPLLPDRQKVDSLYKKYRLMVMLAVTLGYGFVYTCRLGLSVVKKPLIDSGIFTADQLGLIGSAIFYGYAFGKLTNGFLADYANLKRFFTTGIVVTALINIAMGWSPVLLLWIILWGLNGWFQGFGAPTGAVALATWFSNRERGRYYGIWSTAHSMGEGLTFFASAALVQWFGWRYGFWGPGALCLFVAVGVYFLLQDRPQTLGLPSIADWKNDHGISTASKGKTGAMQFSILKMPAIWILGISSATMYMTRYAINSWGMLYLQEAKGYSQIEAGAIIGLNTIAGLLGCVAYGFISDNLFRAKRPPVTFIFGIVEIISLLFIFFYPPGHPLMLTIAFVVYGFTLSGILAAIGGLFAIDIAPKRASGATMGFIGVFSYLGAAVQERISGSLIEQGTTLVENVRHYDFSQVILFWIGASVISLILAASLWKVQPRD
ncbi:MAG: MFS transporter [Candidatus Zhuqueibacterota bacterium]